MFNDDDNSSQVFKLSKNFFIWKQHIYSLILYAIYKFRQLINIFLYKIILQESSKFKFFNFHMDSPFQYYTFSNIRKTNMWIKIVDFEYEYK